MDPIMEQERKHLEWTKERYAEIIADSRELFDALPSLYGRDPDVLNDLLLQTHNRTVRLERSREKPYFARIDFAERGAERPAAYYIGKIGALDRDERMVTLDWRAPVATLYYDSNIGEVEYRSPGGTGCGDSRAQAPVGGGGRGAALLQRCGHRGKR